MSILGTKKLPYIFKAGLLTAVVAVLTSNIAQAENYTKITRLGNPTTAVCKGGVSSKHELQTFINNNQSLVNEILSSSGWSGNPDDFFTAIAAGEFVDVSYDNGQTFAWMGQRKGKKGVAKPNKIWAGKGSVDSYELSLNSNGSTHRIAIPKICCNVALISSTPIPQPVAAPAPKAVAPVIAKTLPFLAPFIGAEKRHRAECVDTSSTVYGLQGGILKPLSDRTNLLLALGWAQNDRESSFSSAFADIGVETKVGDNGFVGGGVGLWDFNNSDDSDGSVFVQGGAGLPWNSDKIDWQWFVQARVFTDTLDETSNNRLASIGLRALFK